MTEIGSIINTVARTAVITSMDMIIIMVDSISIMLLQNIFTGITKNGMGTINAGIIPEIDITIAGTKSTINAGMITGIDITIARVIGCTVIIAIIMIIVGHMKGPLSASK
jgi:hypothetical protein